MNELLKEKLTDAQLLLIRQFSDMDKELLFHYTSRIFSYNGRTIYIKNNGDVLGFKGNKADIKTLNGALYLDGLGDIDDSTATYLLDNMSQHNTVNSILIGRKLTSTETSIIHNPSTKEVRITTHGRLKNFQKPVDMDKYDEFMSQYKVHFPYLDDMLSILVYGNETVFKKNFLYILAPSNWGKTLVVKALCNCNMTTDIPDHDLLTKNTGATSLNPQQLVNNISITMDEFKYFTDDMKKISYNITLAPKYQSQVTIDLGVKLLLSADMSDSLSGIVDEQLINRVLKMDLSKQKELTTLPMIKERRISETECINALSFYIGKYVDDLTVQLIESPVFHNSKMKDLIDKFDIAKTGEIDTLENGLIETIGLELESYIPTYNDEYGGSIIPFLEDGVEKFFIKKAKKTLKTIWSKHFDEGEAKHAHNSFNKVLNSDQITNHMVKPKYVNGKTSKGIVFTPSDDYVIIIEN